MGKRKSYFEKLKDPRWQKKRLQIFERDSFTCQKCGDTKETLNVHHLRYIKNADPWEYMDDRLITLCQPCHEDETNNIEDAIRRFVVFYIDFFVRGNMLSHEIVLLSEKLECHLTCGTGLEDELNLLQEYRDLLDKHLFDRAKHNIEQYQNVTK